MNDEWQKASFWWTTTCTSEPSESLYRHSNLHETQLNHIYCQWVFSPFTSVLYALSALFMPLMHFLCLFIFSLSLRLIFLFITSLCKWCVLTFGCLATHSLRSLALWLRVRFTLRFQDVSVTDRLLWFTECCMCLCLLLNARDRFQGSQLTMSQLSCSDYCMRGWVLLLWNCLSVCLCVTYKFTVCQLMTWGLRLQH